MPDWTFDTLKEHFETLLKERDLRVSQQFDALDKAVNKAEIATEKRFESVNEFRGQLNDQSRSLMPRPETEALIKSMNERNEAEHQSMNDKVQALSTTIEKTNNQKAGGGLMLAYVVSGISLLIAIVTLIMKILS